MVLIPKHKMMVIQSGNQNFAQAIFWLHDVHYWLPRATKTLLVSSQALCYIKKERQGQGRSTHPASG